jgi:hypothetical protein
MLVFDRFRLDHDNTDFVPDLANECLTPVEVASRQQLDCNRQEESGRPPQNGAPDQPLPQDDSASQRAPDASDESQHDHLMNPNTMPLRGRLFRGHLIQLHQPQTMWTLPSLDKCKSILLQSLSLLLKSFREGLVIESPTANMLNTDLLLFNCTALPWCLH